MSIATALVDTEETEQAEAALPFWLVNVPRSEWPEKCPDFLINVSDRDRAILGTPDSQFRRLSWKEVQECIRTKRIDGFRRLPSDLRRYLAFNAKVKEDYGSVNNYIIQKMLQWTDQEPKDADAFNNPDTVDLRILYNHWPYGIDIKIIHLVVWTKFDLDDDPATGELTAPMRQKIDDFVERKFRSRVPENNVIWFRNWKSLKSIQGIEHFHVMLHDPDMDFVREVTNGDIPTSQRVIA
ncbi:hypothetical protein MMC07_008742 [Pseudocyphellaria aurata]|nr:hypothetical protein [Pseudocyphellaria aurata]